MFFILRAKLFFCSIFTLFTSACFGQSCDQSVVPPAVVNGVDVSVTSSGSVSTYAGSFTSCTTTTPPNSVYLGQAGNFSYTMHFSQPVNHIVVAITATGGNFHENFIFTTNTGIPQIEIISSCHSLVNDNQILSGENSGNMGGGGEFIITAPVEYTSLTITGSGGENGALLSICSNSIIPVICFAGSTAPSLSLSTLSTGCFASTTNLESVTASNIPAGTILTWHSALPASSSNRLGNTVVNPGTYYAAFYDAVNDCYSSNTSPLSVNRPQGNISAGPDLKICLGESVTLSGTGGSNYSWNNNVNNSVSFSPSETAIYTLSGLDVNNCPDNDQVIITVSPLPGVNAGPDLNVCPGTEVILNGSGALTYYWEKQILNGVGFQVYEGGTYLLTGTDANGCQSMDEITINLLPEPLASFHTASDKIDEIVPFVKLFNTSSGSVAYSWDFGDASPLSNENEPEHSYPGPGSFLITLVATNDAGCKDTATQLIDIKPVALYYVPNSFTPNGDQQNNVFTPSFNDSFVPEDYKLQIYNRWGELLFESHDHLTGWDGTYANREVMPGTYTWVMGFHSPDDNKILRLNGSVNLIK
jgi:gliding motility-associated-like protein